MKEELKETLFNYLMLLGVLLIFLTLIFLIVYYFNNTTNECVSNPFVFGAKKLQQETGREVYGFVSLINAEYLRISFDANNISIENIRN